jgi:hypothetical protein
MPFTKKEQKKLDELELAFSALSDPRVQTSPSVGHIFAIPYEKHRREKELKTLAEKIADLRAKKILSEKNMDPDTNYNEFYKLRDEEEKKLIGIVSTDV